MFVVLCEWVQLTGCLESPASLPIERQEDCSSLFVLRAARLCSFLVKTANEQGQKVFVNMCGSAKMPLPPGWTRGGAIPPEVRRQRAEQGAVARFFSPSQRSKKLCPDAQPLPGVRLAKVSLCTLPPCPSQVEQHLSGGQSGTAPPAMRFPMSMGATRIETDHQGSPCLGGC